MPQYGFHTRLQETGGKYQAVVFAAYLMAWLLPGFLLLSTNFQVGSWNKLLFGLMFFCAWHLAFKNFLRSLYYSLVFFVLLSFDLFFFYIYQEPPGTPVLLSIGDSNVLEAADFMRGRGLILFGAIVFAVGVWLLAVKAAQRGMGRNCKYYNATSRRWAQAFLLLLAGSWLVFTTAPFIERSLIDAGHHRFAARIAVVDQQVGAPSAKMRAIFPVGRLVSISEYYREDAYLRYTDKSKAQYRYNARQTEVPAARQIYVLVIGETARADHFPLNGYGRGQPSFLAGEENVVPLTNIVSPWSNTKRAVPAMLTPAVSGLDGRREHVKSLVSAFREAGFKSYWISNQLPIGMRETEISHYAREAHQAIFMNVAMRVEQQHGRYDGNLLAPLENLLSRKEAKQFFVLHLLGAHDAYEKRYPPEFDFFKPSLLSLSNPDHHDRRNKREVINSYDNAMRYTDFFLAKLIEAIKKQNAVASVVYSADHGETLFDGECHRSGHGSSAKQEFPIAAMVWVSNEYKRQWPARFRQLKAHASQPITAEYILPTTLDLAAIESDRHDSSRSLAHPAFKVETRWVNAPGPLDWDAATTKGSCNILVAR